MSRSAAGAARILARGSRVARWSGWLLICVESLGCGHADSSRQEGPVSLPKGVIATVGSSRIRVETVASIAVAQSVDLPRALERAIADALFAAEAEQSLPLPTRTVAERAALGRAMLSELARQAEAGGEPTDLEVESLTRERWIDLDRPPSARVTHAVALRPATGSAEEARQVARTIQEAVRETHEPEAFIRAAESVPHGAISVRTERLPFITADGRGISTDLVRAPAGTYDKAFAAAANSLATVGSVSGVIETRFGFHVMLLEELLPAKSIPLADRRVALRTEILSRRADLLRSALEERLRASSAVQVSRDVDEQTAQLSR